MTYGKGEIRMKLHDLAKRTGRRWVCTLLLSAIVVCTLTACGKGQQAESGQGGTIQEDNNGAGASQTISEDYGEGQSIDDMGMTDDSNEEAAGVEGGETGTAENKQADEIKNRFGENCISEQTFEVELSEYSGKVWFVPYAPGAEGQALDMQIVQDGEILTRLYPYVPDRLEGQTFTSLDAVSFFDVNYDGYTDIVLIETYGDTSFAAIYYGFAADADEYDRMFFSQSTLSETISDKMNPLTIGELRSLLSDKKNGEFTSYQEAYMALLELCELSYATELTGDLIYVDDDDTPELAIGHTGYWVSLYTYRDGKVYTLMDHWAYGAMGNVGYEYIPKSNRLRNYNNDYAGLICYTTYMTISNQHVLDVVTSIKTYNFDDVNGNGMPDEDEMDSAGYYGASYIDGEEITDEQYAAYDAGEYEYIDGAMSFEELMNALSESNG
ncbi:MAG: hypothetical protein K2L82_08825 [Lachnospiraceae bacterium]|nr:hypothetical protein [Lachnospiraceae bacterium]